MDKETLFKAAMFELITASALDGSIDRPKIAAAFRRMSAATGNVADIIERMMQEETK